MNAHRLTVSFVPFQFGVAEADCSTEPSAVAPDPKPNFADDNLRISL
jgi:hypothetical protein